MSNLAEALKRAIGAVNEASRLIHELSQFRIEGSNGDELDMGIMGVELDMIHSELHDALYGIEEADDEDEDDWDEDDEEDGDWDDDDEEE